MIPFAPVTSLYAALLSFVFVVLSVRVIRQRRSSGVSLGTADKPALERVARVHANFAEYVPLALLLLLLAESAGSPGWMIHLLGIALVLGRLIHALGVSRAPEDFRLRVFGVAATLGTIIVSAVLLLARVLTR